MAKPTTSTNPFRNHQIIRFYSTPGCTEVKRTELLRKLQSIDNNSSNIFDLQVERCYHIEINSADQYSELSSKKLNILQWLLKHPFDTTQSLLLQNSHFEAAAISSRKPTIQRIIEVGPRFNFSTSYSTNAVAICHSLNLTEVCRFEVSRRYCLRMDKSCETPTDLEIQSILYDRMTECVYTEANLPKRSFNESLLLSEKEPSQVVDVLDRGEEALNDLNKALGLAFDTADLTYYTNLFRNVLQRNPTTVECFDLAQSNSEHSRHWFFKGRLEVDGIESNQSLIEMIIDTQVTSNANNVIKFSDNSSAIQGYQGHSSLRPLFNYDNHDQLMSGEGSVELRETVVDSHLIFTAETHNFPTGVAPFSGATTGTGGRIRDVQCVGRGGYCIAGTAGYSVGNLRIPGYSLPWEEKSWKYPDNFASPLDILIEASNGASDYGNKFGEPVIGGFVRSFGLIDNRGERREWIKPIMFSGGMGTMETNMTQKLLPKEGQKIVKIGGPVYRIGVGGGSASSVEIQGDNKVELDFNAVQRGDAEMEQKLNRVVRACCELGARNPIVSIHDQGAGGNGNVLKELVEPTGGVIYANKFDLGDPTINTLELWGAEYQESNALLCQSDDLPVLINICKRERCPINVVGKVTNTGRVVLAIDETEADTPFSLDLELVLGKMPRKLFKLERKPMLLKQLNLPQGCAIYKTLERVLRLPSVASKRYLTNKVDRCVTGLVAQQQCIGPLHTPLADCAVVAVSHFGHEGIASSIGEQPIKGLLDPAAGARLSVAEALSNLVFAVVSELKDVKCSGNWMWPAKLPGEGATLVDACKAMCQLMNELGIAIDGGKDSLSMAARIKGGEPVVKSPGTLVVSTYAPCPDVRKKCTPDLKCPAMGQAGILLFVDLSAGHSRLGGSALAQVFQQLGSEVPDVYNVGDLKNAFQATQQLIKDGAIQAGHDVSDGGLITTILEMCFGGLAGVEVNISHKRGTAIPILFAEEIGWILEVLQGDLKHCLNTFEHYQVPIHVIGRSVGSGLNSTVAITVNDAYFESTVLPLFRMWEETSFQLEMRQTIRMCAETEFNNLSARTLPKYRLTFDPDFDFNVALDLIKVPVAVIREEGTNGDREMAAALVQAGFRVWDVTMEDLLKGTTQLQQFRGVIFPGGFSYADVLGSAKGWSACLQFNQTLQKQFQDFYTRNDTFSLGVCNGCQLMALIGWIGTSSDVAQDRIPPKNVFLEHNHSERFECRWSSVRIEPGSKAIMLKHMEDSIFGVWVAHGEGRFTFRNDGILEDLVRNHCVALRYVDDFGTPTETYPLNPNGSSKGIAGICSADGRHLAMMPHPERCAQLFQWPYLPPGWQGYQHSPWRRMFRNAYEWCLITN